MDHLETNIKEEEEEEKISPKHASKLQFSIAQIMGFDRGERKPEKEEVEEVEERPSLPAKLWRPLAHCPTTSSTSSISSTSSSLMLPSEPPAIALLRHYTMLRSRDPWRSLMPPGPGPGPLLPPSLTPPQHFRFPTFPFPESTKILGKAEESLPSLTSLTSSKQKSYPCPQCGKVFNAHYNLTRHMPVHTGKREQFWVLPLRFFLPFHQTL